MIVTLFRIYFIVTNSYITKAAEDLPAASSTKEHTMRLSTKGRFAVTAMIDVALRESRGPVSLSAISVRYQLSLSYLEQLFSRLRAAGLVDSTRGPGGGYTLARRAEAISVADIIAAVEGQGEESIAAADAMTQDLWNSLSDRLTDHMRSISLRSLVDAQRAREPQAEADKPVLRRGVYNRPNRAATARSAIPNSVFALGAALSPRG
jgi:Rrf2 family iron-sulfur cluster assembly transcriptional regulator